MSATLDAAANTIRGVCIPYPEIGNAKVDTIVEIVKDDSITDAQIERIREIISNPDSACEQPMSYKDAADKLKISTTALKYHIRKGHIRRCSIPGASRARGVVAADIRNILNGKVA